MNGSIHAPGKDAENRAYENIRSAADAHEHPDGLNAVLAFFNIQQRVDDALPLEKQLNAARGLGITERRITLEGDWYLTSALPMLAKTKDGRMLAVLPRTSGGCKYVENGKKIRVTKSCADMFTGEALCFYLSMGRGRITAGMLSHFLLRSMSAKNICIAFISSGSAVAAGLLLPWVNNYIFKFVIPSGVYPYVSMTALIFTAIITITLMSLIEAMVLKNTLILSETQLQGAVFSRLLLLKPGFFERIRSGELSHMVMEFADISRAVSAQNAVAMINMLLSLIFLFQINYYAPQLTGYVLLISLILAALSVSDSLITARAMKKHSAAVSEISGFSYELFSGIEQVKLNRAEPQMIRRWSEKYLNVAHNDAQPFIIRYMPAVLRAVTIISTAVIFILGTQLRAPDYIAFSIAFGAYIAAFTGAAPAVYSIAAFRSLYTLVKPMLDADCEDIDSGKLQPDGIKDTISFRNIKFSYADDLPPTIDGLTLDIKAGESIGIAGHSGCGKSTLIRLLLGFETPDEGSIIIDGIDLREIDLKAFRSHTGTVLQNSGLIPGDIYANITLARPYATADEVNDAVRLAGLDEDIAEMPMGLHTPVGNVSTGVISGGQLQRILIARALISKPALMILDEATSALDNVTQAKIAAAVNALDCTKIIIAHRLSTIEHCDRIIVMEKGRISAMGTYDELKKSSKLFNKLTANQKV